MRSALETDSDPSDLAAVTPDRVTRRGGHAALVSLRITITIAREGFLSPFALSRGRDGVALSEIDRNLLERCLQRKPRAWEDFVDRFLGLVVHVVNHTARARSIRLAAADRDDLCAEVFLAIVKNDFALLRNFRGKSSLATYLTVVARRIVVRELLARMPAAQLVEGSSPHSRRGRSRSARFGRGTSGRSRGSRAIAGRSARHRGPGGADVSSRWQELPRNQRSGRHARKQHRTDPQPSAQQDAPRERRFRRDLIAERISIRSKRAGNE